MGIVLADMEVTGSLGLVDMGAMEEQLLETRWRGKVVSKPPSNKFMRESREEGEKTAEKGVNQTCIILTASVAPSLIP